MLGRALLLGDLIAAGPLVLQWPAQRDGFANDGLWLAILIFMAVRAVTLAPWYRRVEQDAAGVAAGFAAGPGTNHG